MDDMQSVIGSEPGDVTGRVLWHVTMSLDGFIAGPNDAMDWAFGYGGPSPVGQEVMQSTGAILAGRRTHEVGLRGGLKAYGGAWTGPMFVLTHKPPAAWDDPTVTFLTDDIATAVATAHAAAEGRNVVIFGANTAKQCINAGLIDEVVVHLMPVLLGQGTRLYDSPETAPIHLDRTGVAGAGQLTDLRYRVMK
jgi:dihydrofolate reductase